MDELAAFGERFAERTAQRGCLTTAQFVGVAIERDDDRFLSRPNRYVIAGEFLDQERVDSVPYIPTGSSMS